MQFMSKDKKKEEKEKQTTSRGCRRNAEQPADEIAARNRGR
jgi:hypothetical protein